MFIRATQTAKRSVTYLSEDGSSETRVGGDWTWRNQNPGNLGAGAWANRHGAIGKAGGFAVFPGYDTGKKRFLIFCKDLTSAVYLFGKPSPAMLPRAIITT